MNCKILVVSDSHGEWQRLARIIRREKPFNALIHCGDGADDLGHIALPENVKVVRVEGNVDKGRGYGLQRIVFEDMCGKKFMVAHGDQFRVVHDLAALLDEGMRNDADLVCFGHTHETYYHNGTTALFNPGPADKGCYGVIIVDDTIQCMHKKV